MDDTIVSNGYWAQLGGVPLQELNRLEREFLAWSSYELFVTEDEYWNMYTYIYKQGC